MSLSSPPASITGVTTPPLHFLTYDEYADSQNKQNELLKLEFKKSHAKMDAKFDEHDKKFDKIDERFDKLENRMGSLEAQMEQMNARQRNSDLSNPLMPIRPLVTIHPIHGRREPDPQYFPRTPNDLYALRNIDSVHKQRQLWYLVEFYELYAPGEVEADPNQTIERLELVLGLKEERFDAFRKRAQQFALHPPTKPLKRNLVRYGDLAIRPPTKISKRKAKQYGDLAIFLSSSSDKDVEKSRSTHVGWATGPCPMELSSKASSTGPGVPAAPTSARPRQSSGSSKASSTGPGVPAAPSEAASMPSTAPVSGSNKGSTTNPNTSVRTSSDKARSP
ncbi:hypothetical protein F5Y12DRAFT_736039 [Xylaria sp. FL1777]|nr:hypothetical protein F5Y12DRAFT_736039 [Xylaria sp. FL1777]